MDQEFIKNKLEDFTNILLINGTMVDNPGLFYGKTGIAIFFFEYSRYTNVDLFQDYAMELIEEIQKQITLTGSARYDVGLAGIGSGIEYLIQHGFLEEEVDNVLSDFDERMYRAVMYEPYPDFSLIEGLTGWGRYFIYRLKNKESSRQSPIAKQATEHILQILIKKRPEFMSVVEHTDIFRFLYDLNEIRPDLISVNRLLEQYKTELIFRNKEKFPYLKDSPIGEMVYMILNSKYFDLKPDMEIAKRQLLNQITSFSKNNHSNIGLINGYAGSGLCLLSLLNPHYQSWYELL